MTLSSKSFNPLQVQTKHTINVGNLCYDYLFQSPIGTNKTLKVYNEAFNVYDSFNPLQVQTKHVGNTFPDVAIFQFQSPIGTNKTANTAFIPTTLIEFQSPIGTNKTQALMWHRQQHIAVSIPYRYKQNQIKHPLELAISFCFNPLQVQTKRKVYCRRQIYVI